VVQKGSMNESPDTGDLAGMWNLCVSHVGCWAKGSCWLAKALSMRARVGSMGAGYPAPIKLSHGYAVRG
jgi:hypothetical protein